MTTTSSNDTRSITSLGSSPLARRSVLGLAGGVAVAHLSGSSAVAGRRTRRTVALPDGIRPEGITSGPGTTYYVGSLADGRIVTGDLLRGTGRTLLEGAAGRSLRGLQWDHRSGLVWAAGSVGAEGHVYAVHGRSGAIEADILVPGASFLNDLDITCDTVWVTDSQRDRLTAIGVDRRGKPQGGSPSFLDLRGEWPVSDPEAFNANGIRELEDRSLVLNNSRVGGLWNVDPDSGRTTEIPVRGGPGLVSGDGLELDGDTLYDVRGTGEDEVAVLRLKQHSHAWRAQWRGVRRNSTLDVPTTATVAGRRLWAVNARFGVASPDTASYWITRLPR